jgi:acetyl esterase/lipase
VIWIHGGAWRFGDKGQVQGKPRAFADAGYVLVSVDYRLVPTVGYKEQVGDVARAIRWVHDHVSEYGGDPDRLFLIGHSSGAHVAALVATDERYLKQHDLSLGRLSGVVLLDGAGYDLPRQIEQTSRARMKTMYTSVFGNDLAAQRDASPAMHIGPGKGIAPFLMIHAGGRADSRIQSEAFGKKLRVAGIEATIVHAEGKNHATINREFGQAGDGPTVAVFDFLRAHCQQP